MKLSHNYCFCDIARKILIPNTRWNSINAKWKICLNWPRSFVLRTTIGQHPAILTKDFNFCHNYFSYFSITLTSHPLLSSSNKRAPLNKARILKYPRKCDESPLFYSLEKNVKRYIRLCLVLDGRRYADPESLESKRKNPNNFNYTYLKVTLIKTLAMLHILDI